MTKTRTDWRVVDGVATTWFDAPSLIEGAALAGRIVQLSAGSAVDVRAPRVLEESVDRWRVADPEGNELVIVSGA